MVSLIYLVFFDMKLGFTVSLYQSVCAYEAGSSKPLGGCLIFKATGYSLSCLEGVYLDTPRLASYYRNQFNFQPCGHSATETYMYMYLCIQVYLCGRAVVANFHLNIKFSFTYLATSTVVFSFSRGLPFFLSRILL